MPWGGNGWTSLDFAVFLQNEAIVELLLEKGANIEAKDGQTLTPLLSAVHYGGEQMVKLLLEKGADIEAKDNNGQTPLSSAVHYRGEQIVKLLLRKGANVEAKDVRLYTWQQPRDLPLWWRRFSTMALLPTQRITREQHHCLGQW